MKAYRLIVFVLLILSKTMLIGQESNVALDRFELRLSKAVQLDKLHLYAESAKELNEAIAIAQENGLEEQRINTVISLAELMRKTRDFKNGRELLENLESIEYPALHVRKLGRIAAIYYESKFRNRHEQVKTIEALLHEALNLAKEHELYEAQASLKNELGTLIAGEVSSKQGIPILLESAALFEQSQDTQGYVVAMTHVLDHYQRLGYCEQADSLFDDLLGIIEGKGWYQQEIYLYNLKAHERWADGDSLGHFQWKGKALKSDNKYLQAINSNQMASFRVLHDTEKFKEKAKESELIANEKAQELEMETARTRELFVYLSILVLLVVGVFALLFRERKLKDKVEGFNKELNVANEKYHMLIVESNHRIKNNLQMIISMLEYASKDIGSEDKRAIKRMSGKIHTISALHKHLYVDVHNERVDMNTYFSEIVKLYEEIAPQGFQVNKQIDTVAIKSERIVYFGLILNELLANTIEHSNAATKSILLEVTKNNNALTLNYQDGAYWEEGDLKGTGRKLIKQLVQRIGGFDFHVDSSIGKYQFQFHV